MTRLASVEWLQDPALQRLLGVLSENGEEARVVGGAVRNTLMGRPIADVDIATTALPGETVRRAEGAGLRAVPTGIAHGTVTVVADGRPFEVTTLRRDVETDGRHAVVAFGRDWRADAERRDFTINALYCDAKGEVLDLVGGIKDVESRTLRFIGDPARRIAEDHLRTLRFFRFFAWYGEGRPDADGLRACARAREDLARLSAERVWGELRRLLEAPDPSRALLWMRQAGVLTAVLPESERWGIDAIHGLTGAERAFGWAPEAMLRLAAIVPPDAARLGELARRLRLSTAERDRLLAWASAEPVAPDIGDGPFRARLFFGDRQAIVDRLRLGIAAARAKGGALDDLARLSRLLEEAERFEPPPFPLRGADLATAGVPPGPAMGAALKRLQGIWVDSGFALGRDALLARL